MIVLASELPEMQDLAKEVGADGITLSGNAVLVTN